MYLEVVAHFIREIINSRLAAGFFLVRCDENAFAEVFLHPV